MAIIFEASPSYNTLIVVRPGVQGPYNDCTQEHIDQGFSWREGSISFYHPDSISCLVEFLVGREQSTIGGDPRYAIFQMAEVAIPRQVFAAILTMINALRGPPRSGAPA